MSGWHALQGWTKVMEPLCNANSSRHLAPMAQNCKKISDSHGTAKCTAARCLDTSESSEPLHTEHLRPSQQYCSSIPSLLVTLRTLTERCSTHKPGSGMLLVPDDVATKVGVHLSEGLLVFDALALIHQEVGNLPGLLGLRTPPHT